MHGFDRARRTPHSFAGVRLFFNNLEEVDLCAAFKECGVVAWIIGFKDCIEVL